MDTSKIKNILIIILVFLNAFLLALVLVDDAGERAARNDAEEELREILDGCGITAADGMDFFREPPQMCTVLRTPDEEMEKVSSILGEKALVEDLGGNIYFYSGKNGQANLRGTGEMDFIFNGNAVTLRGRTERALEKLMEKSGIEICGEYTQLSEADNASRVELCCAWEGFPIYNARLSFDVYGDSLLMASGVRQFDTLDSVSSEEAMDCVSAVMRFVEIVKNDGFICSRIDRIEAGYIMSVAVSGESSLTPVWRIDADTGTLYVNAITGKTETF